MTIALRADRALFRFSGPDAEKLLHDVITTRVVAEAGPARWWALLSPQGKVQAEGLLDWQDGAFWLDTHASVADSFYKRMRMYKLRAQLDIADLRATHRLGWSAGSEGAASADGRAAGMGFRLIGTVDEAADWTTSDIDFQRARLTAGIGELGRDFDADTAFPHDIGMDLLGGVDFKKGCYVGQEVVSRMQYRGTARRRPVIVSGLPAGVVAGTAILAGEREAGTIGQPIDGAAVGIVRLDRISDGVPITAAGAKVDLRLPEWAPYRFGEAAAEA